MLFSLISIRHLTLAVVHVSYVAVKLVYHLVLVIFPSKTALNYIVRGVKIFITHDHQDTDILMARSLAQHLHIYFSYLIPSSR